MRTAVITQEEFNNLVENNAIIHSAMSAINYRWVVVQWNFIYEI